MKNKVQKTNPYPMLIKTIKILFGLVIIIFGFLFINSNKTAISSFSFGSSKGNSSVNEYTPSELKWQSQFKGVNNLGGHSEEDKKNMNFLQYESSK